MEPEIVYQNNNLLIINKPSGLLAHPYKYWSGPTVASWILEKFPEIKNVGENPDRPGMVHRLDRDTSGLMVIAKNQGTFAYLKKLFQEHKVKKTYLALVCGEVEPREGTIAKPIGINNGSVKRTVRGGRMVKEAITEYRTKKVFSAGGPSSTFSLLEVSPRTGRTHQIRVHLASIGHPVAGDALYGSKKMLAWSESAGLTRIFLHAESLEFTAENGERIKAAADLPSELDDFLRKI